MELYKQIKKDIANILLLAAVFLTLWNYLPFGRDDTDGEKRSGMKLLIDAKTGCQYLGYNSGITPRLNNNGKQICKT